VRIRPERPEDAATIRELTRAAFGRELVREALARADARGEPLVLLEGDPVYYGRFGFRAAAELGIEPPEGVPAQYLRVLALSAYDPALRGRVAYPDAFRSGSDPSR
jgi:putative acetyltransferase